MKLIYFRMFLDERNEGNQSYASEGLTKYSSPNCMESVGEHISERKRKLYVI